ncbi:hypothetical protein BDN72DRAFT_857158 [Pluteus cervinus]|uniref:Uncharacterized protein n=1 Tax=Pluteus cervinus TaxID=181527 RepID=A0ACD3AXV5_9AGAR|nr:hypothetical protein BDN72DRAFT_857158 [Pluteus cervinus]
MAIGTYGLTAEATIGNHQISSRSLAITIIIIIIFDSSICMASFSNSGDPIPISKPLEPATDWPTGERVEVIEDGRIEIEVERRDKAGQRDLPSLIGVPSRMPFVGRTPTLTVQLPVHRGVRQLSIHTTYLQHAVEQASGAHLSLGSIQTRGGLVEFRIHQRSLPGLIVVLDKASARGAAQLSFEVFELRRH